MKLLLNTALIILTAIFCNQIPLQAMKRTLEDPEQGPTAKRIKIEDPEFTIVCSNNQILKTPLSILKNSSKLWNMTKDLQAAATKTLLLENIGAGTMHTIVRCLKLINNPANKQDIIILLCQQIEKDCLKGLNKDNFKVYQEVIVKLLAAVQYLDIPLLFVAVKSVIGNNLSTLFPLTNDGKRTIVTECFMDVEQYIYPIFELAAKSTLNFEQQVAQFGRNAIPKNLVVEKIMPEIIVDLLAAKHGVEAEQILNMLQHPASMLSKKDIFELWNTIKGMLTKGAGDEAIEKLFNLFDQKINNLPNLDLYVRTSYTEIKNQIQQLWLGLQSNVKTEICNHILNAMAELESFWSKSIDADYKNKVITFLDSMNTQDHLSLVNILTQETLLSKPDKDIHKTVKTKLTAFLKEEAENLEGEFIDSFKYKLETIIQKHLFTISEAIDNANQLREIYYRGEYLLGEIQGHLLNGFIDSEQLQEKIMPLLKNDTNDTPSALSEKIKDPYFQMLVLANTNNTDLMEWLDSSNGNYISSHKPKNGLSPLYGACLTGNLEAAQFIITHGFNIDTSINPQGDTALHVACKNRDLKLVQFLLENGANPNILDQDNSSPLINLLDMTWEQVEQIKDIDIPDIYSIVELLIKYGTNVNIRNDKKKTALDSACAIPSFTTVVELLLDYGAHIEALEGEVSPLEIACIVGALKTVKLLIQRKASVNAKSNFTALMCACSMLHSEIVQILLEHNADINAKSLEGKSVYNYIGCRALITPREGMQEDADKILKLLNAAQQNEQESNCCIS